jgi:hypothetical protein
VREKERGKGKGKGEKSEGRETFDATKLFPSRSRI